MPNLIRPPIQQTRPAKPSQPPPPLSKDALAGKAPLRTFGDLAQFFKAKVEDPVPTDDSKPGESPASNAPPTPEPAPASAPNPAAQQEPNADPQPESDQSSN